jgi:FkbM family methyltransferase
MPDAAAPAFSVILPVYNGTPFLRRAVASLRRQTFPDWELLAVDDGSSDGSAGLLDDLAAADPRIRVFHHPANRGVSAARNTAIAHARGGLIAYLDHDDEFYPGHLARAWDWRDRGEVLVFRYDQVEERSGRADRGRVTCYDPARRFRFMFHETIAVPLAVVHRPDLFDRAGRFDETLQRDVDGDLWRRFARAGAQFTFVPAKCGLYHIRSDSLSRITPPATVWTVPLGSGADRHPLQVPAGEAWRVHRIFDRHEYGGVPLGKLRASPVVLDVGAHVGTFALYAKLVLHRDAVIHCFEPHPPSVALLRLNVAPFPEVTVHPFALGRADGEAELLLHPTNSGGHSIRADLVPRPAGRVTIPVRDAGAVWDELGLDEVDILKVDTEGCEVDILEALGPRLDRVRVVLAEFHTTADRRRIDALLAGHALFGITRHSVEVGVVKYVRADLQSPTASQPPAPARPPAEVAPPIAPPAVGAADRPRVLFASYHCFHDPASGAACCTRDLFDQLIIRGWQCAVFTGPNLDDHRAAPITQQFHKEFSGRIDHGRAGTLTFATYSATALGYPATVFAPDPPAAHRSPTPTEVRTFAELLGQAVRAFRPHVVLTYGGDRASRAVPAAARSVRAPLVLWLHNLAYRDSAFFRPYEAVVVPSEYARSHYRTTAGTECVVLPPVLNPQRSASSRDARRYGTFVNPEPAKGVFWFARLAEVLGRVRPDIPLLVVEGRGRIEGLARCGIDLSATQSVHFMKNTSDPRQFYSVSRVVVMPSLVAETFGRVAAEALLNGIPVLASDRGALPETVGDGGIVLPISSHYSPTIRNPPTVDEVTPWVAALTRAWDDPGWYERVSVAAEQAGRRWSPEVVVPRWEEFLAAAALGRTAVARG